MTDGDEITGTIETLSAIDGVEMMRIYGEGWSTPWFRVTHDDHGMRISNTPDQFTIPSTQPDRHTT